MARSDKEIKEFNINMCDCDDLVSVTVYQKKFINRLKSLAEEKPDEVRFVTENEDGTCVFHLPKKYVHISFGERVKRGMTEEEKAAAAERLKIARAKKDGANV